MLPGGNSICLAMPKKDINLLPREDFEKQPLGRFLIWALNVGRWIVIVIELIVILAFLSRFKLDRDLADLHESIRAKQQIIQGYAPFEKDFRLFQERLVLADKLSRNQLGATRLLDEISQATPTDVALTNLSYVDGEIKIVGSALSEKGLKSFTYALSNSKLLKDLSMGNVSKSSENSDGYRFTLSAKVNQTPAQEVNQ